MRCAICPRAIDDLRRKGAPLRQCGRASLLVYVPGDEMPLLIEMVVDLGVIGLDPAGCGTHSMRRTKPSLIYRRTKNLRAVQLLLGHTKLESTVLYLGIEVEDALELAEQTEVCWLSRIDREWRGTVWLKSTLSGSSASRAANPRK